MAREGKSVGDICRQIKDPAMEVGPSHWLTSTSQRTIWWHGLRAPGAGRAPAPGTQEQLGIPGSRPAQNVREDMTFSRGRSGCEFVFHRPEISSVRQKMMVVNTAVSLSANRGSLVLLTGGLRFF